MLNPSQISTRSFMGSVFQNSECETILRNIVLLQQHANKNEWTPFSWEQYIEFCDHVPSNKEKDVMDAFVNGGRPIPFSSCNLQEGWLTFNDDKYSFTGKMIEMLEKYKK